jgi:hypothetical protein
VSYDGDETTLDYQAKRVRLVASVRFEALVDAFEQAVPELSDADALARLAENDDWSAFARGLAWESPSGFVRVWSSRPGELMRHAGSPVASVVWLIVNYGIAARMFRHDPGAMLYSPLRIEAHAAGPAASAASAPAALPASAPAAPETVVSFDVPSAQLRGFGINKITQAGAELDRALGDLLEDIGLPRPVALRR